MDTVGALEAKTLLSALLEVEVAAELIVYNGFGNGFERGINKPGERLAAVWHNWNWFARHIRTEEIEIPLKSD